MAGPGGTLILSEGNAPPAPSAGRLAVFASEGALYTIDSNDVVKPVGGESSYLLKFSGLCDSTVSQEFALADTGRGDASPFVGEPGYLLLGQGTIVQIGVHAFENTLSNNAVVGLFLDGAPVAAVTVTAGSSGATYTTVVGTVFVGGLLDVRVSLVPGGQLLLYVTVKIANTTVEQ
jgi:hypothetical protein